MLKTSLGLSVAQDIAGILSEKKTGAGFVEVTSGSRLNPESFLNGCGAGMQTFLHGRLEDTGIKLMMDSPANGQC
jgi:hypothetical protein